MYMYGYTPNSKVKEVIQDIVSDYTAQSTCGHADSGSIAAVVDYLEQTNIITAYELRTSDWPNMEGGEAFAAWVEDGYLRSEQWTYVYNYEVNF